jgi:hypothetical protein
VCYFNVFAISQVAISVFIFKLSLQGKSHLGKECNFGNFWRSKFPKFMEICCLFRKESLFSSANAISGRYSQNLVCVGVQ